MTVIDKTVGRKKSKKEILDILQIQNLKSIKGEKLTKDNYKKIKNNKKTHHKDVSFLIY